jgi:hypothetical protein
MAEYKESDVRRRAIEAALRERKEECEAGGGLWVDPMTLGPLTMDTSKQGPLTP